MKKSTCGSREQCTGPTKLDTSVAEKSFKLYLNVHIIERICRVAVWGGSI